MRLAVVANRVCRIGGMERASVEVFGRIARADDVTVIATECEITDAGATWMPVRTIRRPAILNQAVFAHRASRLQRAGGYDLRVSVDMAANAADVVIAHFCQGAFASRFGGLRGGTNPLRRAYQRVAGAWLAHRERQLYRAPGLRGVIAVSAGLKREIMQHYGIEAGRIHVIPNGVDRTVFHPASDDDARRVLRRALGLPEDRFLVVFMGGDWDRKGLADVILALAGLPDAELVVVGRGNVAEFRRLAEVNGVIDRVRFVGLQSQPHQYLAAGDVFACPSRYETFSMSGLEAAACGLPLIVMRANGLEDFVEDGVNGIFVQANAASVRDAIARLMADPSLRCSMSQAAVRTASRFDWDEIASQTRSVLQRFAATTAA